MHVNNLNIPEATATAPLPALTALLNPSYSSPPQEVAVSTFAETDGVEAFKQCAFLRFCRDNQSEVNEPQWYASTSIGIRMKDGRRIVHEMSSKHPKYSPYETDQKIEQALKHGPRTCKNINTLWNGCAGCEHLEKTTSPINIMSKKEAAGKKEFAIAINLAAQYQGTLIRQDANLFKYENGFWREMSIGKIDDIKAKIIRMYGGSVGSNTVESTYKMFFRELPSLPENKNLFDPNPFCANFLNGTLHIHQGKDFYYTTEFLSHNKDDLLNTMLPYNYDPTNTEKNTMLLEMFDRVFHGDEDKDEKIRAVKQMYGACLIPAWPRLFFLWGAPATGKSTIMKIAAKLVSQRNMCSVEPHAFSGFDMQSMLGKLVNLVTDVDMSKKMHDSALKQIIDRMPVTIRRKYMADICGMLPAVHIFGGNAIPETLEGAYGAHDRRWTFIEFKNVQTGKVGYNKEFHQEVFEFSPMGTLNIALEGLMDLLSSRGHYVNPASGKTKMKEWQSQNDSVAQIFEDIASKEILDPETSKHVSVTRNPDHKIPKKLFYEIYKRWAEDSGRKFNYLNKTDFYSAVRAKNFEEKKTNGGVLYFVGIGVGVSDDPDY